MKFTIKKPTNDKPVKRIFPVKDVPKQPGYEWLNETMLRHYIHKADKRKVGDEIREGNGLIEAGALIRFKTKILIDLDCFDAWIESHKSGSDTPKNTN